MKRLAKTTPNRPRNSPHRTPSLSDTAHKDALWQLWTPPFAVKHQDYFETYRLDSHPFLKYQNCLQPPRKISVWHKVCEELRDRTLPTHCFVFLVPAQHSLPRPLEVSKVTVSFSRPVLHLLVLAHERQGRAVENGMWSAGRKIRSNTGRSVSSRKRQVWPFLLTLRRLWKVTVLCVILCVNFLSWVYITAVCFALFRVGVCLCVLFNTTWMYFWLNLLSVLVKLSEQWCHQIVVARAVDVF